jgi:hypothetical protein
VHVSLEPSGGFPYAFCDQPGADDAPVKLAGAA